MNVYQIIKRVTSGALNFDIQTRLDLVRLAYKRGYTKYKN